MAIQPLRGFRDFYPEDQANISYLRRKIADVCALFGYEEFEGPAVESFELYAAKSSDEIVNEQAFLLQGRGDDDKKMVLRPELTPTLARMVANRQPQLTFPLRWWSFGRFWRYERPQKGRGREFYQWNCDIIGDDSVNAEVEILEIIIKFLQSLGLTEQDVVIEINDRALTNRLLSEAGFGQEKLGTVMKYLDRYPKLSEDERQAFCNDNQLDYERLQDLFFTNKKSLEEIDEFRSLAEKLKDSLSWLQFNPSITRGFNYYTGLVFEVSDRDKKYRSLVGGGRYSNLVNDVGGQPVSGFGFGWGDMVILEFLNEKNLLPEYSPNIQACVVGIETDTSWMQEVVQELRNKDIRTVTFQSLDNPGKGLKFASQKKIKFALLIGANERQDRTITVKDLTSGKQETLPLDVAIKKLQTSD